MNDYIKQQFCSYESSVMLVALGFNKPCLGMIYENGDVILHVDGFVHSDNTEIPAILHQQVEMFINEIKIK
jgi:hypothetical protein